MPGILLCSNGGESLKSDDWLERGSSGPDTDVSHGVSTVSVIHRRRCDYFRACATWLRVHWQPCVLPGWELLAQVN